MSDNCSAKACRSMLLVSLLGIDFLAQQCSKLVTRSPIPNNIYSIYMKHAL